MLEPLPVDSILPSIVQALEHSPTAIVEAPPGSGKTTRVAPYLIDKYASDERRILLLQPRRIAVQSVAARIAEERHVKLGEEVGYSVRFDSRFKSSTKLLVATEGIVRRMLSEDITLDRVSVIIFDEFHERSLDSELLLAICRQIQATLRPDLRIVIMSATLSAASISEQLSGVPVLKTEGRMFPVETRYVPVNAREKITEAVARTTMEAIDRHQGDALVFLPGKGEIFQTQRLLEQRLPNAVELLPLFGAMTMEQQSRVVQPNAGRRRVILATNIAETSLTIEGIRIVIDSGMARVMRYDAASGLDRLSLEPICRASAEQRAGRAGRTSPGVAYRLWSEASQRGRPEYLEPELHRVDFASALLQLLAWDECAVEQLPWLEQPRSNHVAAARELLEHLGATHEGKLTDVGRAMARLPLHPRLAKLVVEGAASSILQQASWAAALLSERDPFLRSSPGHSNLHHRSGPKGSTFKNEQPRTHQVRRWSCDLCEQLEAIAEHLTTREPMTKFGEVHRNTLDTISKVADQIQREMEQTSESISESITDSENKAEQVDVEVRLRHALLAAFPDRLAKRRGKGQDRALMVGNKGVKLSVESGVVQHDYFVCLEAEASGSDASVRKASGVEREWLDGDNLRVVEELFYSPTYKSVQCRRRKYWLDLMIEESPSTVNDKKEAARILAKAAISDWQRCFPADDRDLQNLIGRINLLAQHAPELELKPVDTQWLQQICESICGQVSSLDQVKSADWASHIAGALDSRQAAALHRLVPARVTTATGRQVALDYSGGQPVLAIKIQDAFGMKQNPRICDEKVVVQMHLLAPNMRTQQITNDLASFWRTGYEVCKKELKRRYPKHGWPDDPLSPLP